MSKVKDYLEPITMYKCRFCHKVFKANDRHECKWNPQKKNCLTCKHCTGFYRGWGSYYSMDYESSFFECEVFDKEYMEECDMQLLYDKGWQGFCENYEQAECEDFREHYADVMATHGTKRQAIEPQVFEW